MIDHMLLHCIVNGQLGYPGFQAEDVMRSDRFWPITDFLIGKAELEGLIGN
ncbi:hypothetical protein [Pseudomonas sp. RGB]|uniref:hypothetical protein n=1 Tax=Pseudomonas sp. RGB TaxID=2598474 RepID=UPI0015B61234|nr:hypothetical protein [Pseudomonas sp. RGB]